MGGERQFEGVRAGSETTITIDFYYQGQRCRERLKLKPTPANLKRAAQHRAAIIDAINKGVFDYPTTFPFSKNAAKFSANPKAHGLTIGEWLHTWLDIKRPTLKASTVDGYRKLIDGRLIPAFGDILITDLKKSHVREWGSKQTVSNKTIGNIISPLRDSLTDAVEDEIIEVNPLAGWAYRNKERPKSEDDDIDPFTIDEQAAILDALAGQGKNLIQFALWTGLRTSELVALDWGDIDWHRKEICVSRAITQASKEAETTKTSSGIRRVKILAPAMEALIAQKQHTFLAGNEIFQNPRTLERWEGDQPIRKTLWTHALKRANVRYRNPYQTRHTYASMMLSAGEHPMWVAKQMGHKDWTMIARRYGKWMPDAAPDAGSLAVQVFSATPQKQKAG